MSSEEASTCVICLEALVGSDMPIGAAAPCGHCLHVECWDSWVASSLGSRRDCKCPMCNKHADSFVRLFVDFGIVDNDNDSLSMSSDEESNDNTEKSVSSLGDEEIPSHLLNPSAIV